MLIILCEDEIRKECCGKSICCVECDNKNCLFRCKLKLVDECENFIEDID